MQRREALHTNGFAQRRGAWCPVFDIIRNLFSDAGALGGGALKLHADLELVALGDRRVVSAKAIDVEHDLQSDGHKT